MPAINMASLELPLSSAGRALDMIVARRMSDHGVQRTGHGLNAAVAARRRRHEQ